MGGIFLNFFECVLSNNKITVYKTEYSEDYFNGLKINAYLSLYRFKNSIYYWPIKNNLIHRFNGENLSIELKTHPFIFAKILEHGILNLFKSKMVNYDIFRKKQSNVWSIVSNEDLLENKIEGLNVFREMNFNTFYSLQNNDIILGFCLSSQLRNRFTWNRQDFEKNGIDHIDLKGNDEIIFANRQSLKRFLDITGYYEYYQNRIQILDSNKEKFKLIEKTYLWIVERTNDIFLHHDTKISNINWKFIPYAENVFSYEKIEIPEHYFYSELTGKGLYDERLRRIKPYSYESFSTCNFNFEVICPSEYEGTTETFIKKLEKVLNEYFYLVKINFKITTINDLSVKSYVDSIFSLDYKNTDLVIVVLNENHKKLKPIESPYYLGKVRCLSGKIPTQDILIEKIKQSNNEYIVKNLALNIYAKLGGTPWTIEKEDKLKYELIIGIGSSISADKKTILGIAQIFNYNGQYYVGNCIPLSDFDQYSKNLEYYLIEQLNKILKDNLDNGQEFRLIFHIYKSPSSRYEIRAVENVVNKFKKYSFKYAFVHLGYGHNFRIFKNKGKSEIEKGLFVLIEKNMALLHFVPKSSTPLKIEVDKRSTFNDIYYLAKQIFWFSHLSFRSFIPSKKTVTILYPSLMARLTEELKQVKDWDYNILKNLGDKLWFI